MAWWKMTRCGRGGARRGRRCRARYVQRRGGVGEVLEGRGGGLGDVGDDVLSPSLLPNQFRLISGSRAGLVPSRFLFNNGKFRRGQFLAGRQLLADRPHQAKRP